MIETQIIFKFTDKIDKEQQQLKACKKQTELETKLAHEMKLHVSFEQLFIVYSYSLSYYVFSGTEIYFQALPQFISIILLLVLLQDIFLV